MKSRGVCCDRGTRRGLLDWVKGHGDWLLSKIGNKERGGRGSRDWEKSCGGCKGKGRGVRGG